MPVRHAVLRSFMQAERLINFSRSIRVTIDFEVSRFIDSYNKAKSENGMVKK